MKAIADRTTVTPFIGMLLVDQSAVPWGPPFKWRIAERGLRIDYRFEVELRNPQSANPQLHVYHAHAYASTRGSAPALRTPFAPTTMPPFEPWVHGPVTRILWPRATSA